MLDANIAVNASDAKGVRVDSVTRPPIRELKASASFALVALATLLGFAARVYHLDAPLPWLDELTTLLYTSEPLSRLVGELATLDIHPPYYYIVEKMWIDAFGSSRFQARLLSVLLGTACIPLMFVLGVRLIGNTGAIVASFLLATAPLHVQFSRELRMYPLLCVSVLVALIGLVHALPTTDKDVSRTRLSAWLAYVLGCVSAFYAHNTALVLPALAMFWVLLLLVRGHVSRQRVSEFMLATLLIVAAAAPWLATMARHVAVTLVDVHSWLPEPTWTWARSQFLGMFPYAPWLKLLFFALGLAGLVVLIRTRFASAAFLGTFVVGQPMLMWAISFFRPVLIVRALVWPAMLFSLLPAVAVARLPLRWAALTTIALVALQTTALIRYYPAYQQSSSAGLIQPLGAFNPEHDALLLYHAYAEKELRYEAPQVFEGRAFALTYGDKPLNLAALHKAKHIPRKDISGAVVGAKRAWIIEELKPEKAIKPEDDVRPAMDSVRRMGDIRGTWSSGNLQLTLVELR